MKLRNLSPDMIYLYNGTPVPPGGEFNDLTDPCAAIAELLRIKAENNLPELNLEQAYIEFLATCPALRNDPTSLIPANPEGVPAPGNLPPPEGEETSASLGRALVFPPVELGRANEDDDPSGDPSDPNVPPPQSPPPGEAEQRSKDEEKEIPPVAEPVNPFTGEFYIEQTDFELPSVGFPFVFRRIYKSGRTFFGPWGYNWDHNYNVYVRELTDGSIALNTGRLQEDIYADSGDSVLYHAPRGLFAILERQPASAPHDFVVTFKDGLRLCFARPGGWSHPERVPLIRIEDTNGNSQQLIYDSRNQLATVVDTVGRRIDFIYGSCDLLEALRPDFLQAPGQPAVEIKYLHANDIEQLSAVVSFPTPDFPEGLTTTYEYDDTQAIPACRNNIVRVIDARCQVIVENLYGTETTEDSFNRVVKQYFQGGECVFVYTNLRFVPPFDEYINDAFIETEVYESGRPMKLLTFNFRGNLLDERYRLCSDGSNRVWSQSYRYNTSGQLTEHYYANGTAVFYTYDENNADVMARGNLLKVTRTSRPLGALSRTISTFTYDPVFRTIKTMRDEAGAITEFVYDYELNPLDRHGHLVKIKYPDATLADGTVQANCERVFEYDQFGQLKVELSPEKRRTSYEYFLSGTGAGLVRKITAHDPTAPVIRLFQYDVLGNIASAADASGNDTRYEHNLLGQLIRKELPAVNGRRATYRYEYNEDRKISREYEPRGDYADAILSDPFLLNEYFYDVAGWLREARKFANTAAPQVIAIQRDAFGNVTKLMNASGDQFSYRYDDRNLVLTETAFANAAFPLTTKRHYDIGGNLDKTTFPDGNSETYSYDEPFGRLAFLISHVGVRQQFSYGVRDHLAKKTIEDAAGRLLQIHRFSVDEKGRPVAADINGLKLLTLYDKDDRVTATINHLGDKTAIVYDGAGRISSTTDPLGNRRRRSYDAAGNLAFSHTDSLLQNGTYFSFGEKIDHDERNRPVRMTDAFGNAAAFVYDDRNLRTAIISPPGDRANYAYDLNGLPVRSAAVRAGQEFIVNRWNRDPVGRLTAYEDADQNTTTYGYDERGDLARIEYADQSAITRVYNPFRNLETETDCNGSISTFGYNNAGQLTQIDFQVGGGALATPAIVYGYDSFGRNNLIRTGTYDIARTYDDFNRLTDETQSGMAVKWAFDDLNRTTAFHFPDGRTDRYKIDALGRITEVRFEKKGSAGCLIGDFAENSFLAQYECEGLFLKKRRLANGTATEYGYDGVGRLASATVKDPSGNTIDGEQYLFDSRNKKRFIARIPLPGAGMFLKYDDMGRMAASYRGVTAAIPAGLSDQPAIDNFLSGIATNTATSSESYVLSDTDKRNGWLDNNTQFNTTYNNLLELTALTANNGTNIQYTFDRNGNRIADDLFRYYYDALDNLVRVVRKSDSAVVLEQVYDGEGRVVERKENGLSGSFFYNNLQRVHEIHPGGVTVQKTLGAASAEYIAQSKGPANYFCHQNSVLSLTCLTDKSGSPAQYCDFSAFGSPSLFDATRNAIAPSAALIDIVFSGAPYIGAIAKYDFGKRIYDFGAGVFLQRDLAGHFESGNQHLFCLHDPINRRDASGLVSDMWTPPLPAMTPLTEDEIANQRKLLKDVSFGVANAISAGSLAKILDQKSTGALWSDVGRDSWIGATAFSNMASLGFQDAIYEGVAETKGDLTDLHFSVFDEVAGPGAEIGYGLAASVVGPFRGMKNNAENLLPVAEIETLIDSHASTASTWEAVFLGISKLASLAALGAGARQNAARATPAAGAEVVEVNVAVKPNGGFFDRHASVYLRRLRVLYERDGAGNTYTVTDRPKSYFKEIYPEKGTEIYLTNNEMTRLWEYINTNTGRGGWRKRGLFKSIIFDNCSMEIGRMLRSIGVDSIGLHPSLLKFSVENPNLFTPFKAFASNGMIQRTERKK